MRKFFAFVFAFLFFILLPAWLVLFNVRFNLLDADFYKSALREANFYEEVVDVAIDGFSDYMKEMQAEQEIELAFISQDKVQDEIKDLAHELISADFLQSNIENFVDNTTTWLKGDEDISKLKIVLDIEEIKLAAPALIGESMEGIIQDVPDCTDAEINQLTENVMNSSEISEDIFADLSCLPAESKTIVLEMMGGDSEFGTYIEDAFSNVPDEFDIESLILENAVGDKQLKQAQEGIDTFRNVYSWLVISFWILSGVLFLFLVFIALLTMKSARSMFKWLGLTIFIPSLIMTVLVLLSRLFASVFLNNAAYFIPAEEGVVIPTGLMDSINNLVLGLISGFANKITLPVFILCGLGFVLFIVAFFFKKKPKKPKVAKAAAIPQAPVVPLPPVDNVTAPAPVSTKPKSKSKKKNKK